MSATISLPPSSATPAAQVAQSSADTNNNASASAEGEGSFAALFRLLAGKQPAATTSTGVTVRPSDTAMTIATTETAGTDEVLAALLPFLQAMGLAQNETPQEISQDAALPGEDGNIDTSLLAGIAPALTPQLATATAISAAQSGNRQATQAPLPPILPDAQPNLALQAAAVETAVKAGANEFSTQLTAALESAGDKVPMLANPAGITAPPLTPPAAVQALPVTRQVGTPGWSQEIGNHVVWMANSTQSHAELVLTPPHMGRVEVSLSITGDQASASFASNNPAVRDALEAALPRLREVLADAGIQLSQTQVGAENSRQSAQQEKNGDNFGFDRDANSAAGRLSTATVAVPASPGLKIGRGLVDVFA